MFDEDFEDLSKEEKNEMIDYEMGQQAAMNDPYYRYFGDSDEHGVDPEDLEDHHHGCGNIYFD